MRSTFVYIVGVTDNPVKIGSAADVQRRLEALQIGNQDELTLHHQVSCPMRFARAIERATHRELREHHRRGEWFNVSAQRALEVVEKHAAALVVTPQEGEWDLIERLKGRVILDPVCRQATEFYLRQRERASGVKLVAEANAYVQKRAGPDAFSTFIACVGDPEAITRTFWLQPLARERADQALAVALNALADWYAYHRERALLAQIEAAA